MPSCNSVSHFLINETTEILASKKNHVCGKKNGSNGNKGNDRDQSENEKLSAIILRFHISVTLMNEFVATKEIRYLISHFYRRCRDTFVTLSSV